MKSFWQRYGYWIKLAVSVVLLVLVVSKVDIQTLFQSIQLVPWWYFPVGGLIYGLIQIVASIRWWLLTSDVPLRRIILMTFGTQHLVFLVPSGLTTDILRIAFLRSEKTDFSKRLTSLAVDKVLGLTVLLGIIGSCLVIDSLHDESVFGLFFPGVILICFSTIVLILAFTNVWARIARITLSILSKIPMFPTFIRENSSREFVENLEQIGHLKWRILLNVALAFLFQLSSASAFLVLGYVFNFGLNLFEFMTVVSLMQVVMLMPLSIGGIGLRDVSFVALAGMFGVETNKAIAATIASYPIVIFFAVIGWLISLRLMKSSVSKT